MHLYKDKLIFGGIEYHKSEFIYLRPTSGDLFDIAQIRGFDPESFQIDVRMLGRWDSLVQERAVLGLWPDKEPHVKNEVWPPCIVELHSRIAASTLLDA